MTHFIPCHKEYTSDKTADRFIDHCYKLHGVPKGIVSDKDPGFIVKIWQTFVRKLNTKLNMSTARHPQGDGLTDHVRETMQMLLRSYIAKSDFYWVYMISMD